MTYTVTKKQDALAVDKTDVSLHVYPHLRTAGVVHVVCKTGHNQEFYHKTSDFNYFVIEGSGVFYIDEEEIQVEKHDVITIHAGSRIYYKGDMEMLLITTPEWNEVDEVETRSTIW